MDKIIIAPTNYERYFVDENGEIYKRLKTHLSRNGGYKVLNIKHKGKMRAIRSHRAVAKAFIPNPNNLPIVMHIDDDPSNSHVSNLKWGTQKDNMQDCMAKGRRLHCIGSKSYKFTNTDRSNGGKKGGKTSGFRKYPQILRLINDGLAEGKTLYAIAKEHPEIPLDAFYSYRRRYM